MTTFHGLVWMFFGFEFLFHVAPFSTITRKYLFDSIVLFIFYYKNYNTTPTIATSICETKNMYVTTATTIATPLPHYLIPTALFEHNIYTTTKMKFIV